MGLKVSGGGNSKIGYQYRVIRQGLPQHDYVIVLRLGHVQLCTKVESKVADAWYTNTTWWHVLDQYLYSYNLQSTTYNLHLQCHPFLRLQEPPNLRSYARYSAPAQR